MPSWKGAVNHVAAVFIALVFAVSGVYKALDPYRFAQLLEELLFPAALAMPFTLALAVAELMAATLVIVPRFRRWGGLLASLLLLSFMVYMGARYSELAGKDCSCFPIIKRAVGPGFFIGDAGFLIAAGLAAWWAKPAEGLRTMAVILGAAAVFVGVSFGLAYGQHNGVKAPDSIVVNGKPFDLSHGRFFIFFFDPECSHCNAAAKDMGTMKWKSGVTVIGVPTRQPQWAEAFMKDNAFNGVTSLELDKLKAVFPFGDPPYGVVIENGRQTGSVPHYEENGEPAVTLKQLGVVE
jgi:hypothetical protein